MAAILTVCTGNICRSPAAERLLAAHLGDSVQVSSAGTGALEGHPVDAEMAPLIIAAGGDPSGFAARQITAEIVKGADLILTATTEHRSRVVRLAPATVRRTFTLLELARICSSPELPALEGVGIDARLRELVDNAGLNRTLGNVAAGDDIPDPYRRGPEAFRESFALITSAVDAIAGVLRG